MTDFKHNNISKWRNKQQISFSHCAQIIVYVENSPLCIKNNSEWKMNGRWRTCIKKAVENVYVIKGESYHNMIIEMSLLSAVGGESELSQANSTALQIIDCINDCPF